MATNLHENLRQGGASLHVHNRTESKAKSLIDKGAKWESSPAEIAKKCHITFSCMFADDGLKSTFQAWLSGKPRKGSIYVDSSTVYPGTVKALTAEAEKAGQPLASSRYGYMQLWQNPFAVLPSAFLHTKQPDPCHQHCSHLGSMQLSANTFKCTVFQHAAVYEQYPINAWECRYALRICTCLWQTRCCLGAQSAVCCGWCQGTQAAAADILQVDGEGHPGML